MTKWDLKLVASAWPLVVVKICTCTCTTIARRGHMFNLRSHFVIRACRYWSIFSRTKENWPKRLSPHHSPAQTPTYTMWNFIFLWSSPLLLCNEHRINAGSRRFVHDFADVVITRCGTQCNYTKNNCSKISKDSLISTRANWWRYLKIRMSSAEAPTLSC